MKKQSEANELVKSAAKVGGKMAIDALIQAVESNISRNGGESKLTLNEFKGMVKEFKKHYTEIIK